MGVKLLGIVASMLKFSRLVEMLHLCHWMQFCALSGTQASSQLTGRGALFSCYGKRRVIARTATTSEGKCCSQCRARSLLMGFATICTSTSTQSSQALQQRGQRLTVSLLFGSSRHADDSFGRGCLQCLLISANRLIQ